MKNGKNDRLDPSNYRQVNILSPLSKIMEKIWVIQINKFMVKNKLIPLNYQGSIKGRSGNTIINELYQELCHIKKEKKSGALVAIDQSAAYDIIPHDILKKKMLHMGLTSKSTNMIMNYLTDRRQYVQINCNESDTLLTGDLSVSQGSITSGLLYTIYTLDMHNQTHKINHSNHIEYKKCKQTMINNYVDDCFSILQTSNNNIWNKIKKIHNKDE